MCDDNNEMSDDFKEQAHVFGINDQEQKKCFEDEKRAYFGVLTPRSIKRRCNVTPEFCDDTKLAFSDTWIETVTLI